MDVGSLRNSVFLDPLQVAVGHPILVSVQEVK